MTDEKPIPARLLPCPAKVNLFLFVRHLRSDGFHEIGTVFHEIPVHDRLFASPSAEIVLEGAEEVTPRPEDNLIVKAAALLRSEGGLAEGARPGIRFRLEKNLPAGAGLGGGSSDAAGSLRLCRDLWGLALPPSEMERLGARLGADVAFFLRGGTAFGEGKGELLSPAPAPYPFHLVLATPFCHIGTAWAYRNLPPGRPDHYPDFKRDYLQHHGDPDFYRLLHNDFEAPMRAHFPEVEALFRLFAEQGAHKALLSGSGSSVFGLFRGEEEARRAHEALRPHCRFSALTRI